MSFNLNSCTFINYFVSIVGNQINQFKNQYNYLNNCKHKGFLLFSLVQLRSSQSNLLECREQENTAKGEWAESVLVRQEKWASFLLLVWQSLTTAIKGGCM